MGSTELKQRYEALEVELTNVQLEVAMALEALKTKSDATVNIGNWRQTQERLRDEMKIVESELLQQEIPEWKVVYAQAKKELKSLEARREAIAAEWRKKIDEVTDIETRHRAIDLRCYGLDQTILEAVEKISEKRSRLTELIREMIAPVEPDAPTVRSNKT